MGSCSSHLSLLLAFPKIQWVRSLFLLFINPILSLAASSISSLVDDVTPHRSISYHNPRRANSNIDRDRCCQCISQLWSRTHLFLGSNNHVTCNVSRTSLSSISLKRHSFYHICSLIGLFWILQALFFSAYPLVIHCTGFPSCLRLLLALRAKLFFDYILHNSDPACNWIPHTSSGWRFVYFAFSSCSGSTKGNPANRPSFTDI